MAAKTREQIAAEAKQRAVNEIKQKVPGLVNPERYVGANNLANVLGAREGFIKENLKLDPAPFKAGNYNMATASQLAKEVNRFKEMGLENAESLIGRDLKFNTAKAEENLIRDVYKLDPATFAATGTVPDTSKQPVFDPKTRRNVQPTTNVLKYDISAASKRFEENKPTVVAPQKYPENFTQAVNNYSTAFQSAISKGIQNLNDADRAALQGVGRTVRDFSGKNITENQKAIIDRINDVDTEINTYTTKSKLIAAQAKTIKTTAEYNALTLEEKKQITLAKDQKSAAQKLENDKQSLVQNLSDIKNLSPRFQESFSRYGLSDVVQGIGGRAADLKSVDTGLEGLRGKGFFDPNKSDFFGKLNSEVTDDQILKDINDQSKARAKGLYDLGTAATTDLQSQLTQANQFLSDLSTTDPRRAETQKTIDTLTADLTEAQKDTLEAQKLYEGGQPIAGTQATDAISKFRESLRLPEERTLKQIDEIDPTVGTTVRALSKEYQAMAETPLAATTNPETEAFRRNVEQSIAAQVALGSQLGAEEQRQYQQAARGAQSARGNIFGIGPAVEEAVTTGLAGEQRLQARLGAAQGFLSSGQSMTDAAARDVGLRNALTQSRLGAAQGFIASGPTLYNLASQRLGTQQGLLNNYLAASAPQGTGGFQATPSAANPYAYVNPNAGFIGAQNATDIFKTINDYTLGGYQAQVGAISRQSSGAEQFGQIATGLGNFIKI